MVSKHYKVLNILCFLLVVFLFFFFIGIAVLMFACSKAINMFVSGTQRKDSFVCLYCIGRILCEVSFSLKYMADKLTRMWLNKNTFFFSVVYIKNRLFSLFHQYVFWKYPMSITYLTFRVRTIKMLLYGLFPEFCKFDCNFICVDQC